MTEELHTLIGAYVLDALPEEESAEFRDHLARCETCRQEERELRSVAARLSDSDAVTPPAGLKRSVLAAAAQTPQLPPVVAPFGAARRRWRPYFLLTAAAAAVGVVAVSVTDFGGEDRITPLAADVVAVFDATDAIDETVDIPGAGTLKWAVSEELGAVAVDMSHVGDLSAEQDFQWWLIHDGAPVSLGVMGEAELGQRFPLPQEGDLLAVTIEVDGGAEQPTSEPLVVIEAESHTGG